MLVGVASASGDSDVGAKVGFSSKRISSCIGLDVGSSSVVATEGDAVGLDILPGDDTGD